MATRLIFGCGYLGQRVAARWRAAGDDVVAVTRSPEHAAQFAAEGIRPLVADILRRDTLDDLPTAETVLCAVGYDRTQNTSIEEVYVQGLSHVLDALPAGTGRIVYISSTGVFGDFRGGWVDEVSPCEPERAGGKACLAAERILAAHPHGSNAVVLRMAGIYGPGRIPYRDAIVQGKPIPAPGDGFLNLIHVDDAAAVTVAAATVAGVPCTYLISDGNPVERREYYAELARLLGAPPPRFASPSADSPAAARAEANKRIRNARMIAELGVRLAYPSYREGLRAIVNAVCGSAERSVLADLHCPP